MSSEGQDALGVTGVSRRSSSRSGLDRSGDRRETEKQELRFVVGNEVQLLPWLGLNRRVLRQRLTAACSIAGKNEKETPRMVVARRPARIPA
jgi:hypothetical protein